jgi:hypothetical protein
MRARSMLGVLPLLLLAALALFLSAPAGANPNATQPTITPLYPNYYVNGSAGPAGAPVNVSIVAHFSDLDAGGFQWAVNWSINSSTGGAPLEPPGFNVLSTGPGQANAYATVRLPEGLYQVRWCAEGPAGASACTTADLLVDSTPPSGALSAPTLANFTSVTVRVDAVDAGSGIAGDPISFVYRTPCTGAYVPATMTETQVLGRLVAEVTVELCPGSNVVQATVLDAAGNAWFSGVRTIAVDVKPPTFVGFSPSPFNTLGSGVATLTASIEDDVSGVNFSSVEGQVSADGGITWGPWEAPQITNLSILVLVTLQTNTTDGTLYAVRWRASDNAGNGPNTTHAIFFRVNGEPFLVRVEPPEGGVYYDHTAIAFRAEWADPDGDAVVTSWSSDITGDIGRAVPLNSSEFGPPPGVRKALPLGVHNITIVGDDQHGHRVSYVYQIEIVKRPPPDLRLFAGVIAVAGSMVLVCWYVWKRELERAQGGGPR